jgi:hypothetical protein
MAERLWVIPQTTAHCDTAFLFHNSAQVYNGVFFHSIGPSSGVNIVSVFVRVEIVVVIVGS